MSKKKPKTKDPKPPAYETAGYRLIAKPQKPTFSKAMIEKLMALGKDESN